MKIATMTKERQHNANEKEVCAERTKKERWIND
jgi:hypothetical protein